MTLPAGSRRVTREISLAADPIAVGTALCSSSSDAHLLYEHNGVVRWAEGESAVVEAYADRVVVHAPGPRREVPVWGGPLVTVGSVLREIGGADWSAYGWVAFELSDPAGYGVLARFMLPDCEVLLGPDSATLTATDALGLDALELRLTAAVAAAQAPVSSSRIAVDTAEHGVEAYLKAVDAAVHAIRAGELEKVILSRLIPVTADVDLPATYLAGRRANDPARSFLLRLGGWEAAGFSPEIVASVCPRGTVVTQPLAGTRALDGDPRTDEATRDELFRDPKEVFEHAISVRLAATELAAFCTPETVRVRKFMTIKNRGSVQHLASELAGELRPGADAWDALAGLFPAITASGVPKKSACAMVRRLDSDDRGLYSGAVVTACSDGSLDAALVLRSVYRRDGRTWLRAGAGIVALSTPERELEETREKLASVSRHLVPKAGRAA